MSSHDLDAQRVILRELYQSSINHCPCVNCMDIALDKATAALASQASAVQPLVTVEMLQAQVDAFALVCRLQEAQLAKASQREQVRSVLSEMTVDEPGALREWWFDCDGHYIDVARSEDGKYSILFVDRDTGIKSWLDQADISPPRLPHWEVGVLLNVLRIVREYPDFDGDSIFGKLIDQAIAGVTPDLLEKIEDLQSISRKMHMSEPMAKLWTAIDAARKEKP